MIEEPYANTGLSFIEYNLSEHVVYHIRWIDNRGKDQETQLTDEQAQKWFGYSFLSDYCNNEILILK